MKPASESDPPARRSLPWSLLAKIVFSVALLAIVLRNVAFPEIIAQLRRVDGRWLFPSVLVVPIVVACSAWRWATLSLGLLNLSQTFKYTWVGLFFGGIVPGAVSGDVAKGVSMATREQTLRDSRLPVSIVMDKLVGLWVMMLFFLVATCFALWNDSDFLTGTRTLLLIAAGATIAGLGSAVALCNPAGAASVRATSGLLPFSWMRRTASTVLDSVCAYGGAAGVLWRAAAASAVIHLMNALVFWFAMRAMGLQAHLGFAVILYTVLSLVLALPVSISGIGLRDLFASGLFVAAGMNAEQGVALSWLLLGLSLPAMAVGAFVQLWDAFCRPPGTCAGGTAARNLVKP